MPTRTFSGRYENLARISDFIEQVAKQAKMKESDIYNVKLAVDEACSNIIEHAYGGESKGDIQLTCEVTSDALIIIIKDHGIPFDPESVTRPKTNVPLEDLEPRGSGLFLINHIMDEVKFDFAQSSGNMLTMVKNIES